MDGLTNSTPSLRFLLGLLLESQPTDSSEQLCQALDSFGPNELDEIKGLAASHHVILRALARLQEAAAAAGHGVPAWVDDAVATETSRIQNALSLLSPIFQGLSEIGDVVVIKSLDHWPDLGSDLDLYSNADSDTVVRLMRGKFHARLAERSWGDRLAGKWNFIVPGLPELVEFHIGRLGQTGEQLALTNSIVVNAKEAQFGPHTFLVPSPEDRIMISTLQRMYRHFYMRLCDIVDMARLLDSLQVDYVYLKSLAQSAGLWEGVATYLVVVDQFVQRYGGESRLPLSIKRAARFDAAKIRFHKQFLRIPIFPDAASFYASEWKKLFFSGEVQNAMRLSLLPGLAVAAVLAFKVTGSDKGVW
jgi:hypothetical protein